MPQQPNLPLNPLNIVLPTPERAAAESLPGLWGPEWFRALTDAAKAADATAQGEQLRARLLPGQFLYLFDFVLGTLTYVSPEVEQVLGYTPGQLTNEFFFSLIHPDDVAPSLQSAQLVNQYVRAHPGEDLSRELFTVDNRLRHADGHYVRILYQQWMLGRDAATGAMTHAASICTDITEHKQTTDLRFAFSHAGFADFVTQMLAP